MCDGVGGLWGVLDGDSVVSIGSTLAVSWSRGTALVKWLVWAVGLNGVDDVEEETRSRDGTWGDRTGFDERCGPIRTVKRADCDSDLNSPVIRSEAVVRRVIRWIGGREERYCPVIRYISDAMKVRVSWLVIRSDLRSHRCSIRGRHCPGSRGR